MIAYWLVYGDFSPTCTVAVDCIGRCILSCITAEYWKRSPVLDYVVSQYGPKRNFADNV
jgi:hypothetical protein